MTKEFIILIPMLMYIISYGQDQNLEIRGLQEEYNNLETELFNKGIQIDEKILEYDIEEIIELGLPTEDYIIHKSYVVSYSEKHEQAKWTAHTLNPRVKKLGSKRTNDFRLDPLVITGTADSSDYFHYETTTDKYSTYGYDRGHLVPSADFRWNKDAMSDTYYYSNISPQRPEFNRGIWAELENYCRAHVMAKDTELYCYNIPVFGSDLTIEESANNVAIPTAYIKTLFNKRDNKIISFYLPNIGSENTLSSFVITTEEAENITGFGILNNEKDIDKTTTDLKYWFAETETQVDPIKQETLPRKHFNSIAGQKQVGNGKVNVCGTVVEGRISRSGHCWLNLDTKYPNANFSIMIRKDDLVNFDYDLTKNYINEKVCFEGEVVKYSKNLLIEIQSHNQIKAL